MRILFLDDENWHFYENPTATLVEIAKEITINELKILEDRQDFKHRYGGSWKEIMKEGNIEYNLISKGQKSDYSKKDYDIEYKVVSGNY